MSTPEMAIAPPGRKYRWLLFAIAVPAAVEVWGCWIGLGSLCGFPVLGKMHTDWTLAIGMEAYGAYALTVWLGGAPGQKSREFAQQSALGAFGLSLVGQIAYHLMLVRHMARAPELLIAFVAGLPVVVIALAAILTHMMCADAKASASVPEPVSASVPEETSASVPEETSASAPETVSSPETASEELADVRQFELPASEAVRKRARSILRKEPDIKGTELGRRLGYTGRYGRMLKNSLDAEATG